MDFRLSFSASRQLKEWGCDIQEVKRCFLYSVVFREWRVSPVRNTNKTYDLGEYPQYHLLEDICVKYAKEFFVGHINDVNYDCLQIFHYLFYGKKEKAEKYLLDNTSFNPKNKNK